MGGLGQPPRFGVPRVTVLIVGGESSLIAAIADRFRADKQTTEIGLADLHDEGARTRLGADSDVPDVLIVAAPDELDGDATAISVEAARNVFEQELQVFLWCQSVGAGMIARGRGVIVVVGTVDGVQSESGGALRTASQSGLSGLVRGLGVEWAPSGIRVVGVLFSHERGGSDGHRRQPAIGRHPTAAEIAETVHFMAGPDASYVVAETIRVDGGYSAYQMF